MKNDFNSVFANPIKFGKILVAAKNRVIYCSSNSIFLVKRQLRETKKTLCKQIFVTIYLYVGYVFICIYDEKLICKNIH